MTIELFSDVRCKKVIIADFVSNAKLNDLDEFWNEFQFETISTIFDVCGEAIVTRLIDLIEVEKMIDTSGRICDKNVFLSRVDLLTRCFSTSTSIKDVSRNIQMFSEQNKLKPSFKRRLKRIQKAYDALELDVNALYRNIPKKYSRDFGETCIEIEASDINDAILALRAKKKAVCSETILDYLYKTLPKVSYLPAYKVALYKNA